MPQFRLIQGCLLKQRYAVQCMLPIDDRFLDHFAKQMAARLQIFDHRRELPQSKVIFKAATRDFWIEGILGESEFMVTFMKSAGTEPYEALLRFLLAQQCSGSKSSS